MSAPITPEEYTLPAHRLAAGMSTDDGQDIIEVTVQHGDAPGTGSVIVSVYTPRSDDPEQDEQNQGEPETRIYAYDEVVNLAVFTDTEVDGRDLTGDEPEVDELESLSFDELADQRNWSAETQLAICRDFIAATVRDGGETLDNFAQAVADGEKG